MLQAGLKCILPDAIPSSTQDDVAEALNSFRNVRCYAKRACSVEEYYAAIELVLDAKPVITIDDGMDLIHYIHTRRRDLLNKIVGGCEETTTGIHRLLSRWQQKENFCFLSSRSTIPP